MSAVLEESRAVEKSIVIQVIAEYKFPLPEDVDEVTAALAQKDRQRLVKSLNRCRIEDLYRVFWSLTQPAS